MSLRVKDGDNEIEVLFNHTTDKELGKCTCVTLRFNDRDAVSGFAVCSYKDNFCKATGRKIALARAIDAAKIRGTIDKSVSKKIWETYRKNCK